MDFIAKQGHSTIFAVRMESLDDLFWALFFWDLFSMKQPILKCSLMAMACTWQLDLHDV